MAAIPLDRRPVAPKQDWQTVSARIAKEASLRTKTEAARAETEAIRPQREAIRAETEAIRAEGEAARVEGFMWRLLYKHWLQEAHADLDGDALGLPSVPDSEVKAAWEAFCADQAAAPKAEFAETSEELRVHPTIARLLHAANDNGAGPDQLKLRLWQKEAAADPLPREELSPVTAFYFTHARDRTLSRQGTLMAVAVDAPGLGKAGHATIQARKYGRHRVRHVCEEAHSVGGMHELQREPIAALAVATDGLLLTVTRVNSGVPPAGTSFEDAEPCPTIVSKPLPLFEKWDVGVAPVLPSDPPAGFIALMRALRAVATQRWYDPAIFSPPTELRVRWQRDNGSSSSSSSSSSGSSSASDGDDAAVQVLKLGDRLGCGGSSDIYEVIDTAVTHANAVVKVSRAAKEHRVKAFADEAAALRDLHGKEPIAAAPWVLAAGCRADATAQPVPVLLLSPAAQPLHRWLATVPPDQRLQCADKVASAVLVALQRAHAAKWAHCDVRPANVVVVPPASGSGSAGFDCQVILADWGGAFRFGTEVRNSGVPAYVHDDVPFWKGQPSYVADARIDLHAVSYLWLSVAYGSVSEQHGCRAPWLPAADEDVCDFRSGWIEKAANGALPGVAEIIAWANAQEPSYVLPTRSHKA